MVTKFSLLHHIFGRSPLILGMCNWAYSLHGKPCFLFTDVLKRYSFQKNCTGIWSFLYYRERWYSFLPKIWSHHLSPRRKMKNHLSQKNYMEIWYFFQMFWKDGLFKKDHAGIWSFFYYLETWYCFPLNMVFFPWMENERNDLSQKIHGNMIFSI